MVNISSAIRDTVSISLFNRGLAGKIFEDVKQSGAKVVMKNNDPSTAVSGEELHKELGITQDDLNRCGEVEFE